jgi:hypothetical protein
MELTGSDSIAPGGVGDLGGGVLGVGATVDVESVSVISGDDDEGVVLNSELWGGKRVSEISQNLHRRRLEGPIDTERGGRGDSPL